MNLAVFIGDYVTAMLLLLLRLLPHLQTPSAINSPQQRCAAHGSPAVLRCLQSCQQILSLHRGNACVRVYVCVNACICMYIYVYVKMLSCCCCCCTQQHPLPTRFSSSDSKLKLLLSHLSSSLPSPCADADSLQCKCTENCMRTSIIIYV